MLGFGQCTGESIAAQVVCLVGTVLVVAIFIRALMSWFQMDPRSPVMQVLDGITEPILDPIRRIMPRIGMLDLSPLVAIILLQFISRGLQDFFG